MLTQTLHPSMTIRPDEIMRSGSVQPFSVRSMDPVQFARHEIDPFIKAIRPQGSVYDPNVQLDGGLGMVTVEPAALLGDDRVPSTRVSKYMWAGGALVAGLLGGFLISKVV